MTTLRAGAGTDLGRVRQTNQDSLLVDDGLYLVADGVGGHRGGEVASATAVEAVRAAFNVRTVTGLVEAVLRANRVVWEKSQADPNLKGMGTTLTGLALVEEDSEERLALVNVGDSRAYLLQNGELSQLTEDHSMVEEMVREGRLTRDEADVHPQKSLITRALGLDRDVEVDNWQLLPYRGDRVLLCSDGLTNELSDARIASLLRRLADPDEAAHELVSEARANGGSDNITAVVVDVVDDDNRAAQASAAVADEPTAVAPAVSGGAQHEESSSAVAVAHDGPERDVVVAREPRIRHFTWRVAAFVVALLVVLCASAAAFGWYARRTYYVGTRGDRVAIFRGRPGGLLWFDPTFEEGTGLALTDVPPARRDDVRAGRQTDSLSAARRYVANLRRENTPLRRFPVTATSLLPSTTTTTTVP